MIKQMKFSIVIPLYNKEKSIKNTIQSVLDQSFRDFEVIIVNDGSTDKSIEIIKSFNDERIRIINKKNGGVSSARNKGIKETKHEWIAFLDGDDKWENNYLNHVIFMHKKYPDAPIIAHAFRYDSSVPSNCYTKEGYIENFFKISFYSKIIWSSSVVINKKCFTESYMFREDLDYGEDVEFWSRLSKKHKIAYSPQKIAIYSLAAENRAGKKNNRDLEKWYSYKINIDDSNDEYELKYKFKIIGLLMFHFIKKKKINELKKVIHKYKLFNSVHSLYYALKFKLLKKLKIKSI